MDWVQWLYGLTKALFESFGYAVKEYPLPTVVVFAIVFSYLHNRSWFVFIENQQVKTEGYSAGEIVYGLLGFIAAVFASNVVGFIFNAIVKALAWLFGVTETFVSPFGQHSLEFVAFLAFWIAVALSYATIWRKWRLKNADPLGFFVVAFAVLFTTYVSTTLFVSVRGADSASAGKESTK
jgi:hypothetical protein